MRISKLPTLFLALLACSTAAAQAFDYDDIADGRFRPVQLAGIRPTADGEHYTTIRDGNIFRHRYAVDDAGTALLPAAAEEGAVALDSLDRAMRAPGEAVMVNVRECEFGEYDRILRAYRENPPQNAAEKMALLLRVAGEIAGEARAGELLDAWTELDAALRLLKGIWLDNFVMMPLVSQRLINRPFVPCPERLTEEETAYYRPFLFQATTEEQARDLMNIQGMDFIRGFSGTRMAALAMKEALSHLARSREKIAACGDEKFALLDRRLRVMECLIHTLDNACRYQEILDRTRPDETAPLGTQWPAQGDERILKLSEIARAEIDNCYALAALIEGCETELFNLTQEPENEDIFVMTTALPAQLRRKAEIMLDHMRDADAIYETNNK